MGQAGVAVTAHQVALRALLDGRRDVVQADGALQQGQQAGGVDQPQLQVGLLHQDRVHPLCWLVDLCRTKLSLYYNCKNPEIKTQCKTLVLLSDLMETLSSFTLFQLKLLTKTSDVKRSQIGNRCLSRRNTCLLIILNHLSPLETTPSHHLTILPHTTPDKH